jgi:hypothetical protein
MGGVFAGRDEGTARATSPREPEREEDGGGQQGAGDRNQREWDEQHQCRHREREERHREDPQAD